MLLHYIIISYQIIHTFRASLDPTFAPMMAPRGPIIMPPTTAPPAPPVP